MRTSWIKLLTVLTLCSASALAGCATDDADTSDDSVNTTLTSDPLTGEDAFSIVMPDGITVNLSVRQWQTDMNAWIRFFGLCGPVLAVDGSFGPKTTAATECFQGVNGLARDGIVGPRTLGAMCADLSTMGRTDLRTASHCN
jgi:peptidoglycan hydrolase-like protein with peptidoglycan-binding domain